MTTDNFVEAWDQAPFLRYMLNTVAKTSLILMGQLVLCTLAAYALARIELAGRGIIFALVLMQLMVVPEILGIFLLRQTFKTVPEDLENTAKIEGC